MKVAIVTNNGQTISQHFGRSRYYKIITIENGVVTGSEMRERGTGHYAAQQGTGNVEHDHRDPQGRHGYGAEAQGRHAMMAAEIADCDVLIAGGMGSGAYENFKAAGLNVILTDYHGIEESVSALIEKKIHNLVEDRTD